MITGNEPVYPIPDNTIPGYGGLTIRQHMATQALNGIIAGIYSNQDVLKAFMETCDEENATAEQITAKMAVGYTDAIIAELNKEKL